LSVPGEEPEIKQLKLNARSSARLKACPDDCGFMRYRFLSVTGFVLAGGASRRMGRDKALLRLGQEILLERQVRLLQTVCHSVAVIGPVRDLPGLEVPDIADELPGRGPLGGIYTGLRQARTEFSLFLGCDMPFMEARFLRYLCARALASGADVAIPETPGQGMQPLSAVYRRRALAAIRNSLASGDNKVSRFFSRVSCLILRWPEIARGGFAPHLFANINTPDDFADARRRIEQSVKCEV
jgi:molybdenum cofactor guanylyltransferase